MKRSIQPFWGTYGKSKHEKLKQTKTYIYRSPQNIYTGRTAKNMYITRKEKQYIRISTKNMCKTNERIILRAPDPLRILEILLPIPIHCKFWRFLIKAFFPLGYFLVGFWFCSAKNAGHWAGVVEITWWPQATTYSASFSWQAQWTALMRVSLCTRASGHLAVFSHQTMIKFEDVLRSYKFCKLDFQNSALKRQIFVWFLWICL